MKTARAELVATAEEKKNVTFRSRETLSRRKLLAGSAAAGAMVVVRGEAASAADGKQTFTILHTNDIHSNLIGVGPASEYTPATLNDDGTIGGIERIATLIARRRKMREAEGPVLVLDIGDFSIGAPFGGAIGETGAELQCLSLSGYDATTFGNHEFDSGPAALAKAIAAASKAGHVPPILAANTNFDADDAGRAVRIRVTGRVCEIRVRRHSHNNRTVIRVQPKVLAGVRDDPDAVGNRIEVEAK